MAFQELSFGVAAEAFESINVHTAISEALCVIDAA